MRHSGPVGIKQDVALVMELLSTLWLKAHNEMNLLIDLFRAPFDWGPPVFELRCPKVRCATKLRKFLWGGVVDNATFPTNKTFLEFVSTTT